MSLVGIQFKFPDWKGKLERAKQEINLFIAANMQTNRGLLFDAEGARNGHTKWAPLVFRNGMILAKRGTLRKSIAPKNDGRRPGRSEGGILRFTEHAITIGSSLAYARVMNDGTTKMPGGVIRAKRAKALKIPIPQGAAANENAKGLQAEALEPKLARLAERLNKSKNPQARAKIMRQMDRIRQRIKSGKGPVKFIFRKSVRIPARPFDTWTLQDQNELELALRNKIVEILNR